jgi:hypothetical protein
MGWAGGRRGWMGGWERGQKGRDGDRGNEIIRGAVEEDLRRKERERESDHDREDDEDDDSQAKEMEMERGRA